MLRRLPRPMLALCASVLAAAVPGQRWLDHFNQDLLPFWRTPAAYGTPVGDFPTFRCNDGALPDPTAPCPELRRLPGWMAQDGDREFTRMKSRQTYFYGVAYHLTGDPGMLRLAKAGADFIRSRALDPDTGSAVSYWEKGRPGPPVLERTAQDLAYAQVGLAMYYYLTRDPEVLKDIVRLKDHIFKAYWDPERGLLRWAAKGPETETRRVELVAQLDQVNAYLLLLAPILPEPLRTQWKADLVRLAHGMIERFHAPERHLFWGTLHEPRELETRHTDFGHTAKALWMIGRIGRLTGDAALTAFADREAPLVLKAARLPDGTWASRPRKDGTLDAGKEWWIYAELDQLAETLALRDPAWAQALDTTAAFWMEHMVDPANHEVWPWTGPRGEHPGTQLKIHVWKNGYHSAEHALVGYLTGQALAGKPATLYFALADPAAEMRPYVFGGRIAGVARTPLEGFKGLDRVAVSFTGLE